MVVHFEIVLIWAQYLCMVCAECTMGVEIFSCTPDVLLGDIGHVEARFGPFGNSINLDARWEHGLH
jgi:hypothetical protein